ncbi:MAG: hypothetical protein J6K61_00470 [Clostridia bacterium]|nr:hypothetical protein [Clostridia bacterium]
MGKDNRHTEEEELLSAIIDWQREEKPRKKGAKRTLLLPLLCGALAGAFALFSYFLYQEPHIKSELYRAASFIEDLTEGEGALAVFLGLDK